MLDTIKDFLDRRILCFGRPGRLYSCTAASGIAIAANGVSLRDFPRQDWHFGYLNLSQTRVVTEGIVPPCDAVDGRSWLSGSVN